MELQQGTWLTEGEVEGEVTFPRSHRDWWTTDPQTWQGATSSSSLTPIPNSIPESCPTPQPSPRPPFWEELYLPGCWRYCCFQTPASPRWRQTRMSVPGRSRPGRGTAGHRVPCRGTQTWPGSRSGCTWPAGWRAASPGGCTDTGSNRECRPSRSGGIHPPGMQNRPRQGAHGPALIQPRASALHALRAAPSLDTGFDFTPSPWRGLPWLPCHLLQEVFPDYSTYKNAHCILFPYPTFLFLQSSYHHLTFTYFFITSPHAHLIPVEATREWCLYLTHSSSVRRARPGT